MEKYENPDLKRERATCPFDRVEITNLLDGGVELTEDRRKLEEYILSDSELKEPIPSEFLSHADKYASALRIACKLVKKIEDSPVGQVETLRAIIGAGVGSAVLKDGNPLALQFIMFVPSIMGQGSPEQQEKWLQKAMECSIVGTYAQTELGHGTFLRGLETKATYDSKTQEFVLESPSLTAYKWWPGGCMNILNNTITAKCNSAVAVSHWFQCFCEKLSKCLDIKPNINYQNK